MQVVSSLVVALTITPALTLIMLRKAPIERHESPVVRWLQRGYTALLSRVVRRPRGTCPGPAPPLGLGIARAPLLGQSLLPHFKERDFLMHWVAQPATSAAEMQRISAGATGGARARPAGGGV